MFFAPIGWSSYRPPTYIEVVNYSDTNDSTTLVVPNCYRGDLLLLLDWAQTSDSIPTDVIPAGWTGISPTIGANEGRFRASYKIATGAEDGTTITGMVGSDRARKILAVIRTDGEIQSFQISTPVTQGPMAGDPIAQTIAASGGSPPVIGVAVFGCEAFGSLSPRTTSITPDLEINANGGDELFLQTYTQETVPANYTFDMGDEGAENMLFGFYIHNVLVKSPVLPSTISYVTVNYDETTTDFQHTIPSTVQGGDLLVLHEFSVGPGDPPDTVISGWHRIGTILDSIENFRATLSCGLATAQDVINGYITPLYIDDWGFRILYCFRADTPIRDLTIRDQGSELTDATPTAQVVSADVCNPPLIVVAGYGSDGNVDPRGFLPAKDGESSSDGGSFNSNWLAYKIYNSAPAAITISMSDEGINNWIISGAIEVT